MTNKDEILDKVDIVSHISKYVDLKQKGRDFVGLCPFHSEKTPSFYVHPDKKFFYCFGCTAGGDVIKFTSMINSVDYGKAIELLADEYNIRLTKFSKKNKDKNDEKLNANKVAAKVFYNEITKIPNIAYTYLEKRKISDTIIRKFGLGFDKDWTTLSDFLLKNDINIKPYLELNLIYKNEKGYYDKFRERLIFPIINHRSEFIGFGGRILDDNKVVGKYINSNESEIFQKKKNLFALNLTREEIMKEKKAILCEGFLDVISLYQNGIKNVTASLGTAFTKEQAKLLSKWTNKAIISYDADEAGINASIKAGNILMAEGFEIRVISYKYSQINEEIPNDPDEYINKFGKESFLKEIKSAIHFIEFKLNILAESKNFAEREDSFLYVKEASKIIANLSPVEQDFYIEMIAKKVGRTKTSVLDEVSQNKKTSNHTINTKANNNKQIKLLNNKESLDRAEEELLSILLTKDLFLLEQLDKEKRETLYLSETFENIIKKARDVFNKKKEHLNEEEILDDIKKSFDDEEKKKIKKILADNLDKIGPNYQKQFNDCFSFLKIKKLKEERNEKNIILSFEIGDKTEEEQFNSKIKIIEDIKKIDTEILELKNKISNES
ncbi:MAG: DNA primase [Clostridiales Family XIII bacterium]|jgi:DNA primase|nr:DNA primase [Clostridiales Family XIII bacterium]